MRALLFLVVIGGLVFGVANLMGWVSVSAERSTRDAVSVNLSVDREKVKSDVDGAAASVKETASKATAQVKELGDKAKELGAKATTEVKELGDKVKETITGNQTVKGKIMDASITQVTVQTTAGEVVPVMVMPTTTVHRNKDVISASDLKAGETVAVEFKVEEGRRLAQSITVEI